jgi:hypothetical protein
MAMSKDVKEALQIAMLIHCINELESADETGISYLWGNCYSVAQYKQDEKGYSIKIKDIVDGDKEKVVKALLDIIKDKVLPV